MPSPFTVRAVALLALSSSIACGGMVVFEEPGGGGGGGSGGSPAVDAVVSSATSASGEPSTDVSVSAVAVTSGPGGGDGGAPSGPVGPGPGPSGGGESPTGGGAPPGPSGVGGADSGNAAPSAVSTSASGCSATSESTNQYCYAAELCGDHRLELECEINGPGPWTCWCYEDGQYQGACTEGDVPSCSLGGCCESYWWLRG